MDVMACYDGGKVIYGFGRTGRYLYSSWIIKMWGTLSSATTTKSCANDSKITGYVTMAVGLNSELLLAANCALTSAAKV
jgi:hypothetical protein